MPWPFKRKKPPSVRAKPLSGKQAEAAAASLEALAADKKNKTQAEITARTLANLRIGGGPLTKKHLGNEGLRIMIAKDLAGHGVKEPGKVVAALKKALDTGASLEQAVAALRQGKKA